MSEDAQDSTGKLLDALERSYQNAGRLRAELEALTAVLEDEQAAHVDTLRLLTGARVEVEAIRERCAKAIESTHPHEAAFIRRLPIKGD